MVSVEDFNLVHATKLHEILSRLAVPVPSMELERLRIIQNSKILSTGEGALNLEPYVHLIARSLKVRRQSSPAAPALLPRPLCA